MSLNVIPKKVKKGSQTEEKQNKSQFVLNTINLCKKGKMMDSTLNKNILLTNYTHNKQIESTAYASSLTEESTAFLTQSKLKETESFKKKKNTTIRLKCKSPQLKATLKENSKDNEAIPVSVPVNQIFAEIQERIVKPMRLQVYQKKNVTHEINQSLDFLNHNVSTASDELSQMILKTKTLRKNNNATSLQYERIELENNAITREIAEIKKEIETMTNERNMHNKDTILLINEYSQQKEEVFSLNQRVKIFSQMSIDAQSQKKVLTSALLLIRKRITELKEKIFKYRKNDLRIQNELALICESFKIY